MDPDFFAKQKGSPGHLTQSYKNKQGLLNRLHKSGRDFKKYYNSELTEASGQRGFLSLSDIAEYHVHSWQTTTANPAQFANFPDK